jgi:N6-adenosine-specific RNA methylase IME4
VRPRRASGPKRRYRAQGARRSDRLGQRIAADAISSPTRIQELGLGGINVAPDRIRKLRPEVVDALVESVHERGLINPITVRPRDGAGYWLIAGLHRLMAVKKLKEKTIRAVVLTGLKADEAELVEIDENLIRADLTLAERAFHVGRRKELYEKLHPETKHGAVGRKGKSSQNENSFVDQTVATTGKARATVARDATRAKAIVVLPDIVGTSLDQGNELDALAKLDPEEQHKLAQRAQAGEKVSAKTRIKQIVRAEREKTLGAKQLASPTGEYGLIVSDDEWDFKPWSRETGMDRHASNHYVTASDAHTAEKMHERTKDRFKCAAKDCLLAMWTTVPHLAIAIDLLRMRGFRYVSNYVWGKDKTATGHWNRNKHEILLLGVKGKIPCPAQGEQWDSLQLVPVGEHSEKPEIFLQMLEEYFPNLPKIELNRRGPPRPNWDCWGLEAEHNEAPSAQDDGLDILESKEGVA